MASWKHAPCLPACAHEKYVCRVCRCHLSWPMCAPPPATHTHTHTLRCSCRQVPWLPTSELPHPWARAWGAGRGGLGAPGARAGVGQPGVGARAGAHRLVRPPAAFAACCGAYRDIMLAEMDEQVNPGQDQAAPAHAMPAQRAPGCEACFLGCMGRIHRAGAAAHHHAWLYSLRAGHIPAVSLCKHSSVGALLPFSPGGALLTSWRA